MPQEHKSCRLTVIHFDQYKLYCIIIEYIMRYNFLIETLVFGLWAELQGLQVKLQP